MNRNRSGKEAAMEAIGRRTNPGWVLALTTVAFFMSALDNLVVITALPAIHKEIGGSLATLEWTVNAYTLAVAATIITAAALGDRLGRRRVYITGLLLFTAASATCAVAPSPEILIAARAVQGIGAVIGIWGGIGGLAIAAGPLVSGAVTQGLNWHWIFWVNVPIGLAAAALSTIRLGESYGPKTRLDVPGLALVSSGAVALIWGLVRAGDAGWGSFEVVASLAIGVVLMAGFVAWEARAPEPMLPLHLFKIPTFAAANATAFLTMGTITSAAFLASQYFQLGLGYSPLETGLRFLHWTGTPFLVAPIAGLLSDRIGTRPLIVTGLTLQALGLAWIVRIASTGVGYDQLVLPFVIAGVGISMALPSTPSAAISSVVPADMGKASGVLNTLQRFGSAFAIAVVSAVFAANGHFGSPASVVAGFRPAFAVAAGLSLLGALTALAITSRRRPPMLMNQAPMELPAA